MLTNKLRGRDRLAVMWTEKKRRLLANSRTNVITVQLSCEDKNGRIPFAFGKT